MRPQLFKNENQFDHDFLKVSQETGIPISVLKGFTALESAFNPKAYKYEPHRKDASYGLMQVLYQTAKGFGYKDLPEKLFEPYNSIKYGALFLKHLFKKYNNIYDVIASYNMGFPRPASKTTPLIISIYGQPQPDWKYANQPYVDRVASYIAYYQALEQNDVNKAWEIYNLIKAKKLKEASSYIKNPYVSLGMPWTAWLWLLLPATPLLYLLLKKGKV